jgi:hypothetical protein
MLDSLRRLVLKASPSPAEKVLEIVEQGTRDRQQRLADEEKAEQEADLDRQLAELRELDRKIDEALKEKAVLHQRIRTKLASVIPDLVALDELELTGKKDCDEAFTLQADLHQPLAMRWRDPKLANVVGTVRSWVRRL